MYLRKAVSSLQKAGGIYSLVALSPNVGIYEGGRFSCNAPIRVVQPLSHPNNSIDVKTESQSLPYVKEEGQERKRCRQAVIPAVTTSYEVKVGAWKGLMRVTVCWRELIFNDDSSGRWVQDNLIFEE